MINPGRILLYVDRVIGLLGVAAAALNFYLFAKVTTGPGDDNAIALIFIVGLFSSVLPALGLRRFGHQRASYSPVVGWIWRIVSVAQLAVFLLWELMMFRPALSGR